MDIKLIVLICITAFLFSCNNDLDEAGFFNSQHSVEKRFEMSTQWNSSHSLQEIYINDSTYSVFFMADTHIGSTRKFREVLGIAKQEASAIIVAGDITRGHTYSYDTLSNLMQNVDSVNYFFTTGNHDLYFGNWTEYYTRFGASTYYFTINTPAGKDLYIILDSGSGTLGNSQLEWLKETLKNIRGDYRYCMIATHLNLFRNGPSLVCGLPPEELYQIMDLFINYEVNYAISGHEHKRYENALGPTQYITLESLHDDESETSYLEISISTNSIQHKFINVN